VNARIAVAGGTGMVGRHVVDRCRELGHEPVVLARSLGVDVTTGAGLASALADVDAVVDVTNVTTLSRRTAVAFFESATTHLLAAEQAAGVAHHVVLSIVGVDRVDFGYYLGKRRQEELVRDGTVPWTIVRATQFHEFPGQVLARSRQGDRAPIMDMPTQPVASAEVARLLVQLATGEMDHDVLAAQADQPAHQVDQALPARAGQVDVAVAVVGGAAASSSPPVQPAVTSAPATTSAASRLTPGAAGG
jgi:uncharacterized protein YbjT (DUF2867 family)